MQGLESVGRMRKVTDPKMSWLTSQFGTGGNESNDTAIRYKIVRVLVVGAIRPSEHTGRRRRGERTRPCVVEQGHLLSELAGSL